MTLEKTTTIDNTKKKGYSSYDTYYFCVKHRIKCFGYDNLSHRLIGFGLINHFFLWWGHHANILFLQGSILQNTSVCISVYSLFFNGALFSVQQTILHRFIPYILKFSFCCFKYSIPGYFPLHVLVFRYLLEWSQWT